MAQDSRFDGKSDSNDLEAASPHSTVRPSPATSGAFRLGLVVDKTIGPEAAILQKLTKAIPKIKTLWDCLVDLKVDLEPVEKHLHEETDPTYFFELLNDYLITLHIALEVRSGQKKNVHVFQHKNQMRNSAEAFAIALDSKMANDFMKKIETAVKSVEK